MTALLILLVKVTVILALAWALSTALRGMSAAVRHWAWSCAVLAVLTLPLLEASLPAWRVAVYTMQQSALPLAAPQPIATPPVLLTPIASAGAVAAQASVPRSELQRRFRFGWFEAALSVWALGALLMLARLARGLRQLYKLERTAQLRGMRDGALLLESSDPASMPLTWGWRTSRVLMPAGFESWEPQRAAVVMAHEMAHVRRADWLMQMIAEGARAVYWFHPLVWLALARLREESERAADDAVLRSGIEGAVYARHLLDVARQQQQPFALSAALAMARGFADEHDAASRTSATPMGRRVAALLDLRTRRDALSKKGLTAGFALLASLMIPLAAFAPFVAVSSAQDAPAPQPARPPERVLFQPSPANAGDSKSTDAPKPIQSPEELAKPSTSAAGTGKYEIRGTVTEPGVNRPIMGAQVTVAVDSREIGKPVVRTPIASVITDAQGAFVFRTDVPEIYTVTSKAAAGYIAGSGTFESFQDYATLNDQQPSRTLAFTQTRAGEITGTVVDDETGRPLAGVAVAAEVSGTGGTQFFGTISSPQLKTDENGRFSIKGLRAGSYFVQIPPTVRDAGRVTDKFSQEDISMVDMDFDGYENLIGANTTGMLPVTLISGGSSNAGTVRARKIPYYRALISVEGADCSDGKSTQIAPYIQANGQQRVFGPYAVACGKPALIRMLRPGPWFVEVTHGSGPARRRTTLNLLVRDKNLQERAILTTGLEVRGRLVMAEGADRTAFDAALTSLRVQMRQTSGGVNWGDEMSPLSLDGAAAFTAPNRKPGSSTVSVVGLPAGHYIDRIRYNGTPAGRTSVSLNPGTSAHNLEIVIDNRQGSVTGSVQSNGKPVPATTILPISWPAEAEFIATTPRVRGDAEGKFQTPLPAGDYRFVAIPADQFNNLLQAGVLDRILARTQTVRLARGGSLELTLEVADLTR